MIRMYDTNEEIFEWDEKGKHTPTPCFILI